MFWLIVGVLLWSLAHLFKRIAPERRAAMGDRAKGFVAIALVLSIVLMVIGYRQWDDSAFLWNRSTAFVHINNILVIVAVYLFAASGMKTWVGRNYRHPQLTAVILWAIAHLLVNGDVASLVLFGGLALWAVVEMLLINAQTSWAPMPGPGSTGKEIGAVVGALLVTGVIGYVHVWFGLSPWR